MSPPRDGSYVRISRRRWLARDLDALARLAARLNAALPAPVVEGRRVSPEAAGHGGRSRSARSSFCTLAAHEDDARGGWQGERWEGDEVSRPLGCMERLLNGRRSWSGAMTTAHVSVALLRGPPPTEAELLHGLARVFRRHPLLRSCVRVCLRRPTDVAVCKRSLKA